MFIPISVFLLQFEGFYRVCFTKTLEESDRLLHGKTKIVCSVKIMQSGLYLLADNLGLIFNPLPLSSLFHLPADYNPEPKTQC